MKAGYVRVAVVTAAALMGLTACGGGSDTGADPAPPPAAKPSPSRPAESSTPMADPDVVLRGADELKQMLPARGELIEGWSTSGGADALRADPVDDAEDDCLIDPIPCSGALFTATGEYKDAAGVVTHSGLESYDSIEHARARFAAAAAGGEGEVKSQGAAAGNESQYFTRTASGGTDNVVVFRVGTVLAEVSVEAGGPNQVREASEFALFQAERLQALLSRKATG
ncbi:hypothetical protein ACF08W_05780 [Streptomyces sp. NPDC015144]|uniref:hypothetical protein n=1 Tax=Streptomyces sp. NPDC015144 TaxID=3364944 RepID=UPI0036FADE4E